MPLDKMPSPVKALKKQSYLVKMLLLSCLMAVGIKEFLSLLMFIQSCLPDLLKTTLGRSRWFLSDTMVKNLCSIALLHTVSSCWMSAPTNLHADLQFLNVCIRQPKIPHYTLKQYKGLNTCLTKQVQNITVDFEWFHAPKKIHWFFPC